MGGEGGGLGYWNDFVERTTGYNNRQACGLDNRLRKRKKPNNGWQNLRWPGLSQWTRETSRRTAVLYQAAEHNAETKSKLRNGGERTAGAKAESGAEQN